MHCYLLLQDVVQRSSHVKTTDRAKTKSVYSTSLKILLNIAQTYHPVTVNHKRKARIEMQKKTHIFCLTTTHTNTLGTNAVQRLRPPGFGKVGSIQQTNKTEPFKTGKQKPGTVLICCIAVKSFQTLRHVTLWWREMFYFAFCPMVTVG